MKLKLPAGQWFNVYGALGLAPGAQLTIVKLKNKIAVQAFFSATPPSGPVDANWLVTGKVSVVPTGVPGCWLYAATDTEVDATAVATLPVSDEYRLLTDVADVVQVGGYTGATLPDPASLSVGQIVGNDRGLVIKNGGLSPLPKSAEHTVIMTPPGLSKVIVGDGAVSFTIGAVSGAEKYEALLNDTPILFDTFGTKTVSGLTNGVSLTVSVRAISADGINTDYTVWPKSVTPKSHMFSAFDAKLEAWFDADTLTSFPWLDKSGNGCRGNAVNAVTINNSWANGHKSAVFSGTSSNPPYVQTDVPVTSGVKTLFVVYDITASTNGSSRREQTVLSTALPITTNLDYFYVDNYAASGNALRSLNNAGGSNPAGQIITAGVVNVLAMNMSGSANAGFYHNGTKVSAGLLGIMGNGANWTLGNYLRATGSQLAGNIAEVLIFDGELTNPQRWEVEDYLNIKYTGSAKAHV